MPRALKYYPDGYILKASPKKGSSYTCKAWLQGFKLFTGVAFGGLGPKHKLIFGRILGFQPVYVSRQVITPRDATMLTKVEDLIGNFLCLFILSPWTWTPTCVKTRMPRWTGNAQPNQVWKDSLEGVVRGYVLLWSSCRPTYSTFSSMLFGQLEWTITTLVIYLSSSTRGMKAGIERYS